MFITPNTDTYFKSGLAKSAFKNEIYRDLPLDFYIPNITEVSKLSKELHKIMPKFYQSHDAFMMFYQPFDVVLKSLKKSNKASPVWQRIIEKTVKSDEFYDINKITANSVDLSILASIQFLKNLLMKIDVDKLQMKQTKTSQTQQLQAQIDQMIDEITTKAVDSAIKDTLNTLTEYKNTKESAEEAIATLAGSGGHGYTKEALSILTFLKEPDKFRKKVRILKYAKTYFTKFLTAVPTSLSHQQIVSIYGGVNGITRMFSEKQLSDILPGELVLTQLGDVGKTLLALKIVQKQLTVYQRSASLKPVIFIDKSGSMAESFTYREDVPKISVSSGLALALYKKLNADIYLFDTEVEKVSPAKIVETLLTIDADGGTDIDPVLEEIVRISKQEYLYIIISDGITEANDDVLKKFTESGLAKRTKLILIPPASSGYNWVYLLKQYNNVVRAEDVVKFEVAVQNVLSA